MPADSTRYDGFAVLWRFLLINILAGLSAGLARVVLPLFALEIGTESALLGLLVAANSIGVLLMSLPAGLLVDQQGPKKMLFLGSLVAGGLYLLVPLTNNVLWLALMVALISCFMPLRSVALSAVFMQKVTQVGPGVSGWFRGSHLGGLVLLAPLVCAYLIDALGFKGAYWFIAAVFFALLWLSPPVMDSYHNPVSDETRRFSWQELKSQLLLVVHDRQLAITCGWEFTLQSTSQFFNFFIIVIALQTYHLDTLTAAALVSLNGCSYVGALLLLGHLLTVLGEKVFQYLGCAIVIGALLCVGFAGGSSSLYIGSLLLGLGMGMIQITNITWFAQAGIKHGQGRIAALSIFLYPVGGITAGALGALGVATFGLQAIFFVLIPVFIAFLIYNTYKPAN